MRTKINVEIIKCAQNGDELCFLKIQVYFDSE